MAHRVRGTVACLQGNMRAAVVPFAGWPVPVGMRALAHVAQEKGWAASEKGETCGPKGGEERCFSIAICYGEQTSGGKGMSRLQGLLYRPMLKRACPGSGFGVMRS